MPGATKSGIPGIVGTVCKKRKKNVYALGYLPSPNLPLGVEKDTRYSEIREMIGEGFTPAQPLQAWIDVLASGIRPSQVRVLGINGGDISAAEYRMALAFGVWVGVIIDTGREAAKLFADDDWRDVPNLVRLPYDKLTVRAFIRSSGYARIKDEQMRNDLGRRIHERYHESQAEKMRKEAVKWDDVSAGFKESNRQQADDIEDKLRAINCEIVPVPKNCEATILKFSTDEIETMAELEHARWNVERLLAGWKLGKEKDPAKKITPYLVPWDDLDSSIKDLDRETVGAIPHYLATVNQEVRRITASK